MLLPLPQNEQPASPPMAKQPVGFPQLNQKASIDISFFGLEVFRNIPHIR